MYGARLGTYMTLLTDWNYKEVMWFDSLADIWSNFKEDDIGYESSLIGEKLKCKLGLPICDFDSEQSKFFKPHCNADKYNMGPLVKEMDVIRKIEGW